MRLLSTRIPKSKTDAKVCFGEHTPRACGFRRRAENIVRQTFPFWKFPEACVAKVRARRPNSHAGRARSPFLFRNSGLNRFFIRPLAFSGKSALKCRGI